MYKDYKVIPYSCGQYAIVGLSDKHNTNSGWDFIDRFGVRLYTKEVAEKKVIELKSKLV